MKMFLRKIRRAGIKIFALGEKMMRKFSGFFSSRQTAGASTKSWLKEADALLKGQVVLITGSSRGIGLALAESFLSHGASVVINGRNEQPLQEAYLKLKNKFKLVESMPADITQEEDVKKLFGMAFEKFGRVDILINNAADMGPSDKKIWEVSQPDWQKVLDINVTAPFLCSKELISRAKSHGHKVRILNISSGIVGGGAENLGVYQVSKTGLEAMTSAITIDAEDDSVCVVNIRPRSVRTEMTKEYYSPTEHGLMDDPEVVAPVFLFAATAPVNELMGKTLYDPAFQADPQAELVLGSPLSLMPSFRMQPDTFRPDLKAADHSGAYMHFLQNPMGVYPSVQRVVEEFYQHKEMYQYPDPSYPELRLELAKYLSLSPDHITLGTGSSELILRAIRIFGAQKGQIIVTKPTWGSVVWPTIIKCGLTPVEIPYKGTIGDKNIQHDLEGILSKINYQTRLIYLVNPCNPTGTHVDKDELQKFLLAVPSHVTVLLDEAYIDFMDSDKRFDASLVIDQIPARIIGFRTFSKFFALSGLRVGYAYAKPKTIEFLNRFELPFNVTTLSEKAALAALKDKVSQQSTFENNKKEREKFVKEFTALNIACLPTQTNFILFDCPLNRNKMRSDLQKQGIFMPNVDMAVGENLAMTAVGWPEHNQMIIDFLKRF